MVILLPPVKSFGEEFGQAIGGGLGQGFQQGREESRKMAELARENAEIKKSTGIDLSGQTDPEMRKASFIEQLRQRQEPQAKPLNALQEAQKNLAQAKIGQIESQSDLFKSLYAPEEKQQPTEISELPESETEQNLNLSNIKKIPEDKLTILSGFAGQPGQQGVIGNMAENELNRRQKEKKTSRETFEAERTFHTGFSKKTEEEVNQLRTSIPQKEMALNFSREAVESGDVGVFSLANLAQRTGIKELQNVKGVQLLTASKENLLSNMSRVSAKAQNQWFEQRLNSMFAQVGQTKEANLTAQEMLEGELALSKAYINEFDKLATQDEEEYGFVKKDISKRVYDAMKPLEKEILNRTSYRMKEIEEQEKGLNKMKKEVGKNVTKGNPLTLAMAKLYKEKFGENALKVAEKNGYHIPTIEEFRSMQQRPQEFREQLIE